MKRLDIFECDNQSGVLDTGGLESLHPHGEIVSQTFTCEDDPETKVKYPEVPIKITETEDGIIYRVNLFGPIYLPKYYHKLISYLETASEKSTFIILISSPGGDIELGTIIGSAICNTRARVIGVAVGPICSAATYLWSCCHQQMILDGSLFLFHMSTHGDYGVSTLVMDRASALIAYVKDKLLGISIAKGHLTQEEFTSIVTQSKDIIVDADTMRERLRGTANYLEPEGVF